MIWDQIKKRTFIIAEIGKNHLNNLHLAKLLIDKAVEAGCDAVKFQTHIVDDEQLPGNINSPHFSEPRYKWLKENTLPIDFFKELKNYCAAKKIIFFSTPMSLAAAQMLESLDVPIYKIGSADITDYLMLKFVAQTKKPVIMSSGMSNLDEVESAIKFLKKYTDQIALMHCVSIYPCSTDKLNIKSISFWKKRYDFPIGFSDHSLEIYPAIAAVALGAQIIEKHFTLDRNLFGPDHKCSLLPSEMKKLVEGIRMVEKSLGKEEKILQNKEKEFRPIFRKGLVVKRKIKKNSIIKESDLAAKRPLSPSGIEVSQFEKVIGKKLKISLKPNTPLQYKFLE